MIFLHLLTFLCSLVNIDQANMVTEGAQLVAISDIKSFSDTRSSIKNAKVKQAGKTKGTVYFCCQLFDALF